jgi:hypothetical protein
MARFASLISVATWARLLLRPGAPPLTVAENIAGIWGPLGQLLNFTILVAAGFEPAFNLASWILQR